MAKKKTSDPIPWKDLLGGEEAARRAGRDPDAASNTTVIRRIKSVEEDKGAGTLTIHWEAWQESNGSQTRILEESTVIGPDVQEEIRHPETNQLIRAALPTLTELLGETIPPPRRRTLNTILDLRLALQGMLTQKLEEWYPAWQGGEEGEF